MTTNRNGATAIRRPFSTRWLIAFQEETPMTLEKCQKVLDDLRRSQGTGNPLVRVACGGTVFLGRLARSDSPGAPGRVGTPYGVIVLEAPGLARAPETILQIADIPDDGIRALERAS